MKIFFNKRFEEEVLSTEKLRTTIVIYMLAFAILYLILNMAIEKASSAGKPVIDSTLLLLDFHSALLIFEILVWLRIDYRIKSHQHSIQDFQRYLVSFIEICSPGLIIIALAKQYNTPITILHAPVVYLYFIFIVLSTLRLDFKLSLFVGCMAAIGFFIISMVIIKESVGRSIVNTFSDEYTSAFAKSTVLLVCGVGAAFVAAQIRQTIDRSLTAAEEGSKIINLFGQQISKEVVDEILKSEGALQSKLTKVCVMFIDIRNFTNHVSDKTPAEIVAYQNAFFEIVIRSVTKHHGIINQFLGDGCMVTFGAPVALNNAAHNALKSAMDILKELKHQIKMGCIAPTSIGIGIHFGDAVTGNIGTIERQQYSITGNVVILAARIEQLNKDYNTQILISEDVVQQIRHFLPSDSTFLGKIDLKGWHRPLGIYKIA